MAHHLVLTICSVVRGYNRLRYAVSLSLDRPGILIVIGSETIAHLRENGRITIMFTAFDGPARTARLFGTGTVYEFGTPEYDLYLPGNARMAGSRAVIVIDVDKAGIVS